jgi:protein-disulfide isomerase
MKQKTVFVAAAVGLLLLIFFGTLFYSAMKEEQPTQMSDLQQAALIRLHSPTLGNENAPVVIVEFLDPACGTCRAFYPLVKELMAANPDQIRLVLRHAPFHEGSDQVVAVLEAARRQGKFWPALEALLAAQDDWVLHHRPQLARVWRHLEGIGLDLDRVRADMTTSEVINVVAQDLSDARILQVSKTPEFFVNGKPLPSFGYEQLKVMVDEALASARR